jgi:hypothetical protein
MTRIVEDLEGYRQQRLIQATRKVEVPKSMTGLEETFPLALLPLCVCDRL